MTMKAAYLMGVALALGVGCTPYDPPPDRQLTLVLDRSNAHLLQTLGEDVPEILEALRPVDPWGAVHFRIASISGVAYNKVTEMELPAEDPDQGNILTRKRDVEDFLARAGEAIRLSIGRPSDDSASVVYLPLALELERLAACQMCRSELVIYSDLIEHLGPGKWSLYNDRLLDSLQRAPDAFMRHFERQRHIPDLNGVRVSVVNIPRNTPNSERVSTVFTWYERLWTSKHARVRIAGNYHHTAL